MGWNVFRHHTAGTNDAALTNGDTRQHTNMGTNPYIAAHGNGKGIFQAPIALLHIERMACCVKAAIGGYKHIVAKGYGCTVQNHTVDIAIEIFAYVNVVSVVAIKRLFYKKFLPGTTKKRAYQPCPFLGFGRKQVVVTVADILSFPPFGQQLRVVVCIVKLPQQALFLFRQFRGIHIAIIIFILS